ncbi:acyltransferase family protein [Acetobacter sp.]|jgi:peptidoglycan/LPS O-acetylase OafA/YrhL|uniref:acyltransferase family protein n=1 Tax=Acetobacter sp. TaxID=440 RepID=UPI0025BF3325|nr:acyltransferase [Acetobacter sp.]MCH4091512.1 acyltransferase [Acetobacter sp.]MCI1299490.1 acyltransferase [Acetobacter sp.]MCI1316920.1 acyltransferase [Acetobacter sp.]
MKNVRFDALQSVRGLAALVVVLRHVLACYPLSSHAASVIVFFLFNSPAAVTLFFVLSGFVLTHSLVGQSFTVKTVLTFWTRRVFRILPALVVVTLLSALFTRTPFASWPVAGSDPSMEALLPHDMPLSLTLLAKCLASVSSALVPQNWTVAVELIAALFFPFLWASSRNESRIFLPVVLSALLLSLCAPSGGKGLPFIYGFSFVVGIIAYRGWQNTNIMLTSTGIVLAAVGMSLPTTLLTEPETLGAIFNAPKLVIPEAVCAGFLLFGLARNGPIATLLSNRALLWLGDISFSLYLVHFLVIAIAGRLLSPALPAFSMPVREGMVFCLTLLIGLPVSHLLYEKVEKPANRLGYRISRLFQSSRKAF